MFKEIMLSCIIFTITFLINIRIFWVFKNNKDPLQAITKPWWVDLEEGEKIIDEFKSRG